MMRRWKYLWLLLLLAASVVAVAQSLVVGDFAAGDLTYWTPKHFKGATTYSLVEVDGRKVLKARSEAAASGLIRKVHIDLSKTPNLIWSWRVEAALKGLDETRREGDDYAARLYVVHAGGLFFWRTRALSYVWSGSQPKGSWWPNAFTGNTINVAVESGDTHAGRWMDYQRDVRKDFKRFFGLDITRIDVVAIMSDTDNSGLSAEAYYGNIAFVAD